MGRDGRRPFYMFGSAGIGYAMLVIGILGAVPEGKSVNITVAMFMIVINTILKLSLGSNTFVIAADISANRVRSQTTVLGRAVYVCGSILNPAAQSSRCRGLKSGRTGARFAWRCWTLS